MDIEIRTYANTLCEMIVDCDNTKIREDLTFLNIKADKYEVDENIVEQLITAAFDITRFNGRSDVDLVKEIFENFLNSHEQQEFLEQTNQ